MICPTCGSDNLPGEDACEACGASLTQEDLPAAEAQGRLARCINEDLVEVLEPAPAPRVPEDASLPEALSNLREGQTGCVLVTDADGRLTGIFTERDVLNDVALESVDPAAPVGELMTREPETIRSEHPLAHALHLMHVGDFRHLPVIDQDGRPVGVISSREVINYLELRTRGGEVAR